MNQRVTRPILALAAAGVLWSTPALAQRTPPRPASTQQARSEREVLADGLVRRGYSRSVADRIARQAPAMARQLNGRSAASAPPPTTNAGLATLSRGLHSAAAYLAQVRLRQGSD